MTKKNIFAPYKFQNMVQVQVGRLKSSFPTQRFAGVLEGRVWAVGLVEKLRQLNQLSPSWPALRRWINPCRIWFPILSGQLRCWWWKYCWWWWWWWQPQIDFLPQGLCELLVQGNQPQSCLPRWGGLSHWAHLSMKVKLPLGSLSETSFHESESAVWLSEV